MPSRSPDHAEVVPFTSAHFGVEVMRTWYHAQSFARHSHPYFTVGIMLRGVGTLWSAGVTSTLRPGDVVFIPPGEVHTGGLDDRGGVLSYTALHIPTELVAMAAESRPADAASGCGTSIVADPDMARALRQVDAAIAGGADALPAEAGIVAAIDLLARYCRGANRRNEPVGRGAPAFVELARLAIEDRYADTARVSLAALATLGGVSPFHLAREFKRVLGLAPHQYVIQTRIRRAARLLASGIPISDVAMTVGFADQSHLTTHFRRHLGVTPASWQRAHGHHPGPSAG